MYTRAPSSTLFFFRGLADPEELRFSPPHASAVRPPADAGGGRPRRHPPVRPGEAALPQPGADPAHPRPVDRQVHRASGDGARRPEEGARGAMTSSATQTTQVVQVYRVDRKSVV